MSEAIGYLRVSTREQGRSGLGLAAQRFEIEAFGARAMGSASRPVRSQAVRRAAVVVKPLTSALPSAVAGFAACAAVRAYPPYLRRAQ
jgi:hypothetical protein